METFIQKVHAFDTDEARTRLEKARTLHKEFLETFPLEKIKELTLEEYALGRTKRGSFGWWLEYHTLPLGSIKGGSAVKHVIYFNKKKNKWEYPKQFANEQEAWIQLRKDILAVIESLNNMKYEPISAENLLWKGNMLKGKISYLYHPDKMMPIYLENHLKIFLQHLQVEKELLNSKDTIELNILLRKTLFSMKELQSYEPPFLTNFLYSEYMKAKKYYKVTPGKDSSESNECIAGNYISVPWGEIGDLDNFNDFDEYKEAFTQQNYFSNSSTAAKKANELWTFYQFEPGDRVILNKGTSKIVAVGTVQDPAYIYREDSQEYYHSVSVKWDKVYEPMLDIPNQPSWIHSTVEKVNPNTFLEWMKPSEITVKPVIITSRPPLEIEFFKIFERALNRKGQVILYGPPGTGKTFSALEFIKWKQDQETKTVMEICTFHPSFQYEDFIEGFKPIQGDDGTVAFKLEEGVFRSFAKQAASNPETSYYFIIDELNRGNVPKIFGEMITLLEKDKRGKSVILPQSKESFFIPTNLFIIATMNTSDRSIKMMDAAIKRRFAFIECMPNYDLINESIDKLSVTLAEILRGLNKKLLHLQGRDKQIGHSYFMQNGEMLETIEDLKEVFMHELIPLIQEYCFDDYGQLAEIIGEDFVDKEQYEIMTELFTDVDDAFIRAIEKQFLESSE